MYWIDIVEQISNTKLETQISKYIKARFLLKYIEKDRWCFSSPPSVTARPPWFTVVRTEVKSSQLEQIHRRRKGFWRCSWNQSFLYENQEEFNPSRKSWFRTKRSSLVRNPHFLGFLLVLTTNFPRIGAQKWSGRRWKDQRQHLVLDGDPWKGWSLDPEPEFIQKMCSMQIQKDSWLILIMKRLRSKKKWTWSEDWTSRCVI